MSGAYRDTGAAILRAEALEAEVEELRDELARLRASADERRPMNTQRPIPESVAELHDEVVDLRTENELLRRRIEDLERAPPRATPASDDETPALRAELDKLRSAIAERDHVIDGLRAPPSDNRDAVIARLQEERVELERELRDARERYEAEPPASRDPKTFEERVLAILNRLVK